MDCASNGMMCRSHFVYTRAYIDDHYHTPKQNIAWMFVDVGTSGEPSHSVLYRPRFGLYWKKLTILSFFCQRRRGISRS